MRTRINQNKEQIFCEWRKRWVRLTPEEWVRQQLLSRMVAELEYPSSFIAVEQAIAVGEVKKRCDAVVYDRSMRPILLIECKAETVPLTQKTLDQALTYNRKLNVPNLLLHNGPQSIFVTLNLDGTNHYSQRLPRYADLLRCE
jgi:hypothetical protein